MAELGNHYQNKKHRLQSDADGFVRPAKRVRLESLLENLSLRNEPDVSSQKPKYHINPLVESSEPQSKKRRTADLDTIISEKMAEAYRDRILQGLALIRYCHPFTILVRNFQQWVKRLFNFFIRKYNERMGIKRRMRPFRDFARIVALIRDVSVAFTYSDLLNIVLEENCLEAQRLQLKKDKNLDSEKLREIKDDEEVARESSYTYWDRVSSLSGDVDMDEYGGNCPQQDIFTAPGEISEIDMASLDIESPGCSVEANYGNYYGTNYAGFYA